MKGAKRGAGDALRVEPAGVWIETSRRFTGAASLEEQSTADWVAPEVDPAATPPLQIGAEGLWEGTEADFTGSPLPGIGTEALAVASDGKSEGPEGLGEGSIGLSEGRIRQIQQTIESRDPLPL